MEFGSMQIAIVVLGVALLAVAVGLVKKLVKLVVVGCAAAAIAALGYFFVLRQEGEKPEVILQETRQRLRDTRESVDAARDKAEDVAREAKDKADELADRARDIEEKVRDKTEELEESLP